MSGQIFGPRKRRTRQHVIADQGVHHVQGFILDAGYTSDAFTRDYGYDLQMVTYDQDGFLEPGLVYFQIKASENIKRIGNNYVYDLDIRDYNLWLYEKMPVILILYDATKRRAFWLDVQQYFEEDETRAPRRGAKWVRVQIPMAQRLTHGAIVLIRLRKPESS